MEFQMHQLHVKIFRTNKYEAYSTYLFIFILIKESVLRPDNFLIVDNLSQALPLTKHLLGSYACNSSPSQLVFQHFRKFAVQLYPFRSDSFGMS